MNPKKDVCEYNHIFKWSLWLGLSVFAILLFTIWFIDYRVIRNPYVLSDSHLTAILVIGSGLLSILVIHTFILLLGRRLNEIYLQRFKSLDELGTFVESTPRCHHAGEKRGHCVLLLHGFTASPQQFVPLLPHLEDMGASYYIPNITGFGLNNTKLLNSVRYVDWFRSAIDAFDALSMVYERVSIVGHSLGSILALHLAKERQVDHLVLTSPAVYSVYQDTTIKKMLLTPGLSWLVTLFLPFVPKPIRPGRKTTSDVLDDSVARNLFQYIAIPVNSIREIFKAQRVVAKALGDIKFKSLSVFHGEHDLTADVELFIHKLHDKGYNFQCRRYTHSAHALFEDFDKAECCFEVAQALSK